MWNTIKVKKVNEVIEALSSAFVRNDKDALGEVLAKVEEETGYRADFIYDIFVEQIEDEREDADYTDAINAAADNTITPAYEFDY